MRDRNLDLIGIKREACQYAVRLDPHCQLSILEYGVLHTPSCAIPVTERNTRLRRCIQHNLVLRKQSHRSK